MCLRQSLLDVVSLFNEVVINVFVNDSFRCFLAEKPFAVLLVTGDQGGVTHSYFLHSDPASINIQRTTVKGRKEGRREYTNVTGSVASFLGITNVITSAQGD